MDPLIELDAITNYIQPFLPVTTAIELLNLPDVPYSDMLVFQYAGEAPESMSFARFSTPRQWRFLYYNSHIAKTAKVSSDIGRAFIQGITIPYLDADENMWFVRVQAVSIGGTAETDSDLNYTLSILETTTGSVRTQEQFEKMEQYNINMVIPLVMNDLTYGQIEGASHDTLDALELKGDE